MNLILEVKNNFNTLSKKVVNLDSYSTIESIEVIVKGTKTETIQFKEKVYSNA